MKKLLFILIPFILFGQATKLIDYGFEDYTGDVNTTPGYIFTASASSFWSDHTSSTEVVSTCNGLTAHTGTYYLHQNFYTNASDACLGNAPSSVNDHGNLGGNFTYPNQGYGDNTDFETQITSDTLVVRFYLRTQDNWASVNPGGKCKFTRTYGTDNGYLITHYNISDNRLQIYNPDDYSYGTGEILSSTLYDGNWHAFALMVVINNVNQANNITASVWWDNYNMTSTADLTRTVTCALNGVDFGDGFLTFDFWQNWSATYPSGSMGIDLDDIEIWDGIPGASSPIQSGTIVLSTTADSINYSLSGISYIDTIIISYEGTPIRTIIEDSSNYDTTLVGTLGSYHTFITYLAKSTTNTTYQDSIFLYPNDINYSDSPGTWNVHYTNGNKKIARIGNTIIAVTPTSVFEHLYKSTNNGQSWSQIDQNTTHGGSITTGLDSTFYYFFYSGDNIQMVKFRYDDVTIPAPRTVYTDGDISETNTSTYRFLSSTVDSSSVLYVAAHWGTDADDIFAISSSDTGNSWDGAYQVSTGANNWYHPHICVNKNNLLVCSYSDFSTSDVQFARSTDGGQSWTRVEVTSSSYPNPSMLCAGDEIYIFTQGSSGAYWTKSTDGGDNWSLLTQFETTCGYADPSAGFTSDSVIYVAIRSSNGSGLSGGSCGDQEKFRLARSDDFGSTWTFPDDGYMLPERVCSKNQLRYQTWYNYGGSLEWMWFQYVDSGSEYVGYYDINPSFQIMNEMDVQSQQTQLISKMIPGNGRITPGNGKVY